MNRYFTDVRILILDDDEDDFLITSDYIQSIPNNGFKIEWCNNYEHGIQHLIKHNYDLYFVDYRLGAKTGLEFLKEAYNNKCEEPIVLLTGKGNYAIDLKSMEYGAVDYLEKTDMSTEKMERCIRYAIERSNTHKILKSNEKKYRSIFEKTKEIIFVADNNLKFMEINPAIYNLLGYPREEVIGKTLFEFIEGEEQKTLIATHLNHNEEINDIELILIGKDDEKKHCILTCNSDAIDDNKKYYQGLIHDISNLKKIEKANIQSEKLASAGRILRTIAHEIRNPLNNITLSINQLQHERSREDVELYLDIINRNCNRINDLITELLHTSVPVFNSNEIHDLRNILDEVKAAAIDRLTLKHILLIYSLPDFPIKIISDKNNLKLALLNFVINAIEAMNENSGTLTIALAEEQNKANLLISDTGCGISDENLDKLFEPFYTQKKTGVGLGLTFALNILQAHKATIDVISQSGIGTTFKIYFPIIQ